MKKFVLSASEFDTIKKAEDKVNGWWRAGDLNKIPNLYRVVEVYNLKLKFVKRK